MAFFVSCYAFVLRSILFDTILLRQLFFSTFVYLEYFFHPFTSAWVVLLFWGVVKHTYICRHIYMGLVFLSIMLPYIFCLEHLIHLHLRLLLINTYLLPFFPLYLCSSLSHFLNLLKAVPLTSLAMLVWWRGGFFFSFFREALLSPYILNENLAGKSILCCRCLLSITWNAIPFWLIMFQMRNQLIALLELLLCY